MMRVLTILIALCILTWIILRALRPLLYKKSNHHIPQENLSKHNYEMVPCAYCKTFIHKQEAIAYQDKYYCSKFCLQD